MGSETGGRKCDAWSRFCARKRSVAAGADRTAYARWCRHGESLPAARATQLWARIAGRGGGSFRESGIGEMASQGTKVREKRPTPNIQRPTLNGRLGCAVRNRYRSEERRVGNER